MDRITVIPAHIFLIYCLRIMRNCTVILTSIPDFLQFLRKLDHIGNLCFRITFINVEQCLVVNKLIYSCSIGHIFLNGIISPMWPVMGLEYHICLITIESQRFHDVLCPCVSVTHLGSAECIQIVECSCTVFSHPQSIFRSNPEVHLCRCFGARSKLKFNFHSVNGMLLTSLCDFKCRRNITCAALGLSHTNTNGKGSCFTTLKHCSILVTCSSSHSSTCINILADSMLLKAFRCNYLHIAGLYLFFRNNSLDSTEMINMGMAVDHCLYRKSAQILFHQGKSRLCTLYTHQWIYYNPSCITFYECDI